MPTVREVIADLKRSYKPSDVIAVDIWQVADVIQQAQENDEEVTDDGAQAVLEFMEHSKDATLGFNWDSIDSALNLIRNDPEIRRAYLKTVTRSPVKTRN